MFSTFKEIFLDAWAFLVNPEARQISGFKYPSGNPMSVRAAKLAGLMPTSAKKE